MKKAEGNRVSGKAMKNREGGRGTERTPHGTPSPLSLLDLRTQLPTMMS